MEIWKLAKAFSTPGKVMQFEEKAKIVEFRFRIYWYSKPERKNICVSCNTTDPRENPSSQKSFWDLLAKVSL